jgi:hypothetical protein
MHSTAIQSWSVFLRERVLSRRRLPRAGAGQSGGILATISTVGKELCRTRFCGRAGLLMVVTAILGPAPSALAGEPSVPIKGHYEAMITSATQESDGLHVTDVGEGNASHLGQVTSSEHGVIHPDGSVQGLVVLTAANGDQLFWSDVGTFTSATTIAGTITFTGGTGRFSNASGTADFEAVLSPDGVHFAFSFDGTIQF